MNKIDTEPRRVESSRAKARRRAGIAREIVSTFSTFGSGEHSVSFVLDAIHLYFGVDDREAQCCLRAAVRSGHLVIDNGRVRSRRYNEWPARGSRPSEPSESEGIIA